MATEQDMPREELVEALHLARERIAELESEKANAHHLMLSSLFEANLAVKLIIDPDTGMIVDANQAAAEFYGYPLDSLKGISISDINILSSEEVQKELNLAKRLHRGYFRFKHKLSMGDVRDVDVYSGPFSLHGKTYLFSIIYDVSDSVQIEAQLKERDELYRVILSSISDAVYLTDDVGNFVFVCPNVDVIFGYSSEEIMAMGNLNSLLSLDQVPVQLLESQGEVPNVEYDIKDKFGNSRSLLVNIKKVSIGQATRLFSCRDFSDRKKSEEVLNKVFQEKELYRRNLEAIFHSMPDGLATVTHKMEIIYANDVFSKLCSRDSLSADGSSTTKFFGVCEGACQSVVRQTLETSKPVRDFNLVCRRNGQRRAVVVNTAPLLYSDGRFSGAVLLIKDVTRMAELEKQLLERKAFHGIVGKSKSMQDIFDVVERLSEVDSTLLITGESGTGKEILLEAIHYSGLRASGPLIKVNCAALSENLLESELFGHVRGAFTGAIRDKIGRFQAAEGGTIFLDEIGEISQRLQLKLLRVLDRKEFERVGETKTYKVNAQVIAATNVDLESMVRRGEFREDLYYRLKVMVIHVPPLMERLEDLPLLVDYYIKKFNSQFNKCIRGVTHETMEKLMGHNWPGNIRELMHVIEHAFILCKDEVLGLEHLPEDLHHIKRNQPNSRAIAPNREYEEIELLEVLRQAGGNKAKAARMLGIGRRSLYRRLERFGIS